VPASVRELLFLPSCPLVSPPCCRLCLPSVLSWRVQALRRRVLGVLRLLSPLLRVRPERLLPLQPEQPPPCSLPSLPSPSSSSSSPSSLLTTKCTKGTHKQKQSKGLIGLVVVALFIRLRPASKRTSVALSCYSS